MEVVEDHVYHARWHHDNPSKTSANPMAQNSFRKIVVGHKLTFQKVFHDFTQLRLLLLQPAPSPLPTIPQKQVVNLSILNGWMKLPSAGSHPSNVMVRVSAKNIM